MSAQPIWKVPLRGSLTPDLVSRLERSGIHEFSGHGGHAIAEGGRLPEPTDFVFVVSAPTAVDADLIVRNALSADARLVVVDNEPIVPL